jgi:hypothetical protein
MGHSQFVTVGTLGKRARRQMIMSATAVTACFGVSTFWIWHSYELRSSSRRLISSNASRFGLNCSLAQSQLFRFKFVPH